MCLLGKPSEVRGALAKVSVIPGSGCGCPGHIRVAFGKPEPGEFREAAARLRRALQQLVDEGFQVIKSFQAGDQQ